MSHPSEDPRQAAARLLPPDALLALENEGLVVVWREDLDHLRGEASESRRLHGELIDLRQAINNQYQGKPLDQV